MDVRTSDLPYQLTLQRYKSTPVITSCTPKHDRHETDRVWMLVILRCAAFAYDVVLWYCEIIALILMRLHRDIGADNR